MIDFHTHVVPRCLERLADRGAILPHLLVETPVSGCFCCSYANPRPVDSRVWDARRRIGDMDASGVTRQVISPMPMTFGYGLSAPACLDFWRMQNDGIADMVAAHSDRFSGLGGLPMQDVGLAIAELDRVVGTLGLIGVEIGTRVGPVELDDAGLTAFWDRCDALGALVFIHPEVADRVSGRLEPSVGYPLETARAATRLMAAGLFRGRPNLSVVLSHGGGALPWLLPRLDQAWNRFPDMERSWGDKPSDLARLFHYDALTFDAASTRLMIDRLGADRIVAGSDYPFTLSETPPGGILRTLSGVSELQRAAMLRDNASALIERSPRSAERSGDDGVLVSSLSV